MTIHQTQLQRQNSAYSAVRDRLWNPKNAVKPAPAPAPAQELAKPIERIKEVSDKITELRSRLFEAEKQIELKQELIDKLALDLADANARILHQAEIIEGLRSAADPVPDDAPESLPRKPAKQIIAEVLQDYPDVTWDQLKGVHRTRRLVEPRQRCMYELYTQRPDLSFPAIGRLFGGRDHSTVLHAVHKIKAQREREQA